MIELLGKTVSGIVLVLLLGMIVSLIPAYATETWFSVVPNHTITSPGKVFTANTRGTEEGGEVYTATVEPIADTYVDRLHHWKNFGNKSILCVMGNWSYPGGQTCYISFLKFDLSNIPPSAKIVSAEFYLRVVEYSVDTPEVTTIKAHRYLNSTWDEHDLTWDGVDWDQIQNATSETEIYVDLLETQVWFNWTITEDVKKSKDGFLTEVLSACGESIFFYSKETSLKPYLNITYTFSTPVGGIIWENTTWTLENSPYIVVDDVIVESGVALTITAGVVVKFANGTNLVIDGTLMAQGNATHRIKFTSNNTTPKPGDWKGVEFRSSSVDRILSWIIIEYGGSWIGNHREWAIHARKGSLTILDSIIRFNGYAIRGAPSTLLTVQNCNITNNKSGIWCDGNSEIYASTISNNEWGIRIGGVNVAVYASTFSNNERAIWQDISGSHLFMIHCEVFDNSDGIFASHLELAQNIISNNTGVGIMCHGKFSFLITNCTISGNEKSGLTCCEGYFSTLKEIHFCNIFNNTPYDIVNNIYYEFHINATLNWWGTGNETLIGERVYDYYDDYNYGKVLFKPFLTGPATVADYIPPISSDDYEGAWRNADFTITLTATDYESGVAETHYRINNGSLKTVSSDGQPYISTESSNNTLEYWSVDNAGNEELPHKILTEIKLDNTAPTIGIPSLMPESDVQPDQEVKVLVNVTDFMSGTKNVTLSYNLNDSAIWTDLPMTFNSTTGLYEYIILGQQANTLVKYKIVAYDNAGNYRVEDNNGQYYVYTVIPEFPSLIILPLFMIATLLAVIVYRRKRVHRLALIEGQKENNKGENKNENV